MIMSTQIQFKKLVWEQPKLPLKSILLFCESPLATFEVSKYRRAFYKEGKNPECLLLSIHYAGGQLHCFTFDTIEECQEHANAWWKEKIEDCFTFEVPKIRIEQCIACNGLGQIARLSKVDTAFKYNFETCKTCSGEGKVNCETSENPAQ